jgi:hypothetical protein
VNGPTLNYQRVADNYLSVANSNSLRTSMERSAMTRCARFFAG